MLHDARHLRNSVVVSGRDAHIPESVLDDYVRGALAEEARARVEEHTLFCPYCLRRLQELDLLVQALTEAERECGSSFVAAHATTSGAVRLVAERTSDGTWRGRIVADRTREVGTAETSSEIISLLEAEFARRFPDHRCSPDCATRARAF